MRTIERPRSTVVVGDDHVVKVFAERLSWAWEFAFYYRYPEFTPGLLGAVPCVLVMERCTPAAEIPEWQPVDELGAMLTEMASRGVHHRDVWPGNVVRDRFGDVKLIDWEWAVEYPNRTVSFDLFGPEASGVEPFIDPGTGSPFPMWWDYSPNPHITLLNAWGRRPDVPGCS